MIFLSAMSILLVCSTENVGSLKAFGMMLISNDGDSVAQDCSLGFKRIFSLLPQFVKYQSGGYLKENLLVVYIFQLAVSFGVGEIVGLADAVVWDCLILSQSRIPTGPTIGGGADLANCLYTKYPLRPKTVPIKITIKIGASPFCCINIIVAQLVITS